ncbi:MAG TPA: protoporphyrinogen oxidase [Paenibacillus sp.]|uniref:protoporphyrinogen oxidase n=1 Tax=Paenibacillus sp. TaxID=58172 RepID=UPI002C5A13C7|nr:protoporphyrinogen oxidase [Paenibacillus sp.]HUC91688.1 protoporphyrinogen oxidase [Paenibacillus sp.]
MTSNPRKHIAVIGGGITGLSAAYELMAGTSAADCPVRVTVIERSGRLGGAVQTVARDGFIIEQGPDSFLSRKPAAVKLIRALRLENDLVGMNPAAGKSFIYLNGRLQAVPKGLMLGIPTRLKPFLSTGLISFKGKARASLDLVLPGTKHGGDVSLGSLIEGRLGKEVADSLVSPILAGIYAGDLHRLSTAATFPQLLDMTARHRSLIMGIVNSRGKGAPSAPAAGAGLPEHLRGSMFLSLKGGLRSIVDRLSEELIRMGADMKTETALESVGRSGRCYKLRLSDQTVIACDGIVFAGPAEEAAGLLQPFGLGSIAGLRQVPDVSVANVVMAFEGRSFPKPLEGSGFVVPRKEKMSITACTWASSKWNHTAPEGKVLIRAYVGHAADESHRNVDDEKLSLMVMKDLSRVTGTLDAPLFKLVTRHPLAMPQYLPGHLERIQAVERELEDRCPGLVLAGRSYRGVGIPDCIDQGVKAAGKVLGQLGLQPPT